MPRAKALGVFFGIGLGRCRPSDRAQEGNWKAGTIQLVLGLPALPLPAVVSRCISVLASSETHQLVRCGHHVQH